MEDVIHVDRQDVEEAAGAGGVHRVASVVSVSPGIGSGMEIICACIQSSELKPTCLPGLCWPGGPAPPCRGNPRCRETQGAPGCGAVRHCPLPTKNSNNSTTDLILLIVSSFESLLISLTSN